MRRTKAWKKIVSGVLAAVMLAGSLPDIQVQAVENNAESMEMAMEEALEEGFLPEGTESAPEEASSEEASSEETSTEESEAEDLATEQGGQSEESQPEDSQSEEAQPEESQPEDSQSEEAQPEESQPEEVQPEESQPQGEENKVENVASDYQYVIFPDSRDRVEFDVPKTGDAVLVKTVLDGIVYRVDAAASKGFFFTASVPAGFGLEIPEDLQDVLVEKFGRTFVEGRWVYSYEIALSGLSTTLEAPLSVSLKVVQNSVSVKVNGEAVITGIDEDGTAQIGSTVSIEVTQPGYTLALLTKDENGNNVYTAMELDYDNKYEFAVDEAAEFYVVDPEQVDYTIVFAASRKAKIAGAAGIKLSSLASSAQGYKEIVLNFTAVKNGNDGTETENVYYEVKVNAVAREGVELPAGSSTEPQYYYIPKVADSNTQSKSIQVNKGDLSKSTACSYEFSVRMVHISKSAKVPKEDTSVKAPLDVVLSGNTITKTFATKELYYEDKLGFTKKKTTIFTGQENVLVGVVKYSKNASCLHDLMAVAYDGTGEAVDGIVFTFKNDNDELYVTAGSEVLPGKYKVVVYASVGEKLNSNSPQSGTMYQANTTFTLTVQAGINYIDSSMITREVAVNGKDISFSAVPVGYSGYGVKAKSQKFTYEVKSAVRSGSTYKAVEADEKVKANVSVGKNGKVSVKKGYTVDQNTNKNWIAIVVKAADFEGNSEQETVFVQVTDNVAVPTTIELRDAQDKSLGTKMTAAEAHGARVVVLDQNGNDITNSVTLTPAYKAGKIPAMFILQESGKAYLYVNKPGAVTVKATATNGSKKSKSVKFTINKPSVSRVVYNLSEITSDGFSVGDYETEDGRVTYNAPKGAVISVQMGAQPLFGNTAYYNPNWFDWGYQVTGGKCKIEGDLWRITCSAKETKFVVWLKSNPYRTWTLKFTNSGWSTKYANAPKIELVSGTAYNNAYILPADVKISKNVPVLPAQRLTYKIGSGGDFLDDGSKYTMDVAGITKNAPAVALTNINWKDKTFDLTINSANLKAGSYKYKIAFYKNGVLACKPSTVTVKVAKSSQVKVTGSYTLDTAKQSAIELKWSAKDFTPAFSTKMLNANVGGKANDFTKYFELKEVKDSATGQTKVEIRFKSSVTAEEKAALKGKSITGYVKYSYYMGYSSLENVTSKVTIKIK